MLNNESPPSLSDSSSVEEIISYLKQLKYPSNVRLVTKNKAIQTKMEHDVQPFLEVFSEDSLKAIVHQACKDGNLNLVARLKEQLNLDTVKDRFPNPFDCTVEHAKGVYTFSGYTTAIEAAANSSSLPLIEYLTSFYDLNDVSKNLRGDLQSALVIAAEKNAYDIVKYLLACGVPANSEIKGQYTAREALYNAVVYGNKELVELLVENGAKIQSLNKTHAVRYGKLDIVKYFASKGETFDNPNSFDKPIMDAFESRSVDMVKYFTDTLKISPYGKGVPTEERKKYIDTDILKKAVRSGSIEMFKFLEEVGIPVKNLIKDEIATTKNYHHMFGNFIVLDAVCSYNVNLLKYLFEDQRLMPKQEQLAQLLGYAYDCGSCVPQHQKFTTHAYVYSFLHKDPAMKQLLKKVSSTQNLTVLSDVELLMLFADYTKNFRQDPKRFAYNPLRENSSHLANEIARRNLSPSAILEIAKTNEKLASDVQFYLLVSGKGFTDEQVRDLLKDKAFNPNCDLGQGNTPLHYAIKYRRSQFVDDLLSLGADPDAKNKGNVTPITLLSPGEIFNKLLSAAKKIDNSLYCSMQEDDSDTLVPLLKHSAGNVTHLNIFDLMSYGKNSFENIYNLLCNIDDQSFAQVKKQILVNGDETFLQLLSFAEYFKQTGMKPKEYFDYQKAKYEVEMTGRFYGGCCGTRGINLFMDLLGLDHLNKEGEKLASEQKPLTAPYPAFLKDLKIQKQDISPEKVANALWLNDSSAMNTKISKSLFSMWANSAKLPFGRKEVEECLANHYVMKK